VARGVFEVDAGGRVQYTPHRRRVAVLTLTTRGIVLRGGGTQCQLDWDQYSSDSVLIDPVPPDLLSVTAEN
jgi:hypothetical protein